jgi:hypothetical protein
MISSDYEKIWKDTYGVDFVAKSEKGEKVIGGEKTKSITKIGPFIVAYLAWTLCSTSLCWAKLWQLCSTTAHQHDNLPVGTVLCSRQP